ncbi:NADH-quinone oxidoreductase subunit NuoD [bacterium CG17_big_fil_post_rev_8_21_14_2_50_64_8]|nr:MAG: NADH-quinone oxidoreductase subunit NuoD [bacterium CG17_big_fil_post_rev_8_21_14_2_50_64_8]PJA77088.1 MAG: NADH-quinone oxidoreductase subunit NuoD [bacterium CG_4_9_14_3_um_filter_65_15]
MSTGELKKGGWADQDHVPGIKSELLELNMGPQHPATHGVLRLLLKTDGEIVYQVTPVLGYLHRCAEKIAEGVNYKQWVVYTDRFDYLAPMCCNHAYVTAVEKLMEVEVPRRAEHLRVVTAELSRIASHLIALATFGLDMGAWTPLLYCFREREEILNLLERISGGRMLYNYMVPGGVRYDVPNDGWVESVLEFITMLENKKIKDYNDLLTYNKIFIERTADVGVIDEATAKAYGCTGPVLRGSGVKFDCRRDDSYSIYDKFDFEIPVGMGEQGTVGDCWDRYIVRVREIEQSCRIIRQALESLPDGSVQAIDLIKPVKVPVGAAYSRTESAKGELGHYIISDGGQTAFRNKVRSPSFCNLQVVEKVGVGQMVSDLVALVGSLDIVLGEIDR